MGNARGGIKVTQEQIQPAWQFLHESFLRIKDPTLPADPKELEALPPLKVRGVARVMKAIQPRMTFKEADWILNTHGPSQETISLQQIFDLMKDNQESPDIGCENSFDPITEAFRMISKDTVKGSYVDVDKICQIYDALGTPVDREFVQEGINTLDEEGENQKKKKRMDFKAFRKFSGIGQDDDNSEEEDMGHQDTMM